MSFGILTLATKHDWLKAIGLALSARVSNPGVPVAVTCSPELAPRLQPYFDHVVIENPQLRGFQHKVHLDRYSPFTETFFFDADVLLFRSLDSCLPAWRTKAYTAVGNHVTSGRSPFGLDRDRVLQKIGKDRLVHIDGAGHAYFRKPDCDPLFQLAREVTEQYAEYGPGARYADEDVVDICLTMLGWEPMPNDNFFCRHMSAKKGTMTLDASQGICRFEEVSLSQWMTPVMMHFAAREAPFAYYRQMRRLFRKFQVPTRGLFQLALQDFYETEVKWTLGSWRRALFGPKRPA